ncbi:MAG: hypothetical protein H6Q89_1659 [Myxococcaceae bacterium]|nr:hypothetical protein [Myxococcaceae bacterium]
MPSALFPLALAALATAAPLATINQAPITGPQLVAEFQLRHGGAAKFLSTDAECRMALEAVIDRRLFLQEARRLGLAADPAIVAALKELAQQAAVDQLYKVELTDKARVIDAEVQHFFETRTEELFTVRQLVTRTRPEADALLQQLIAGADFEKLAREKSIAHSSVSSGKLGNLGWGSMPAAWEEVAYHLEKGKLSGVIHTPEGFEILRLEQSQQVPRPEYARAEPQIRAVLGSRKLEARRAAFHRELWVKYAVKEPKIEWSLAALRAAVASRATTEVGSWAGGTLSMSSFVDRLDLDRAAKLPPDHQREELENLRHELIRQQVANLEASARKLPTAPEVQAAVEARRNQLMEEKLFDAWVFKGITTTSEEERKYYDTHLPDFTTPERRHLQQIVVPTEEKARATLKKLAAGAKFESLARTISSDPESAKREGDLGWVIEAKLPPEFSPVLKLRAGEVGGPIRTNLGFHLIKVAEIGAEALLPFEQVKDEAARAVRRQKMEEKRAAWLRKLRAAAVIAINEAEVQAFAREHAF